MTLCMGLFAMIGIHLFREFYEGTVKYRLMTRFLRESHTNIVYA